MNKIFTIFLLTLLFVNTTAFSQSSSQSEKCGHIALMDQLEAQYPGYKAAVQATFEQVKALADAKDPNQRRQVYTIPVVIHIVAKQGVAEQNIADSIIEDQIRVLNEDYRLMNADAGNIRPVFASIQGDAEIEFELKEVKRVFHNNFIPFIPLLEGMKNPGQGGSAAVDPEHNLNIWVCEMLLGAVLGYAYPPADLPNWPAGQGASSPGNEGVVLDYRAFGSNNPASSFYENQGFAIVGRTATHEVGHYLGLRHYWGDGDCTMDDGIEDTPVAAENSQASGCLLTKNTCTDAVNDLPDMWENYMDYSEETCQVAFSDGQIIFMRAVLEGPRSGLLEVVNCVAPTTGNISGNASVDVSSTQTYSAPLTGNDYSWTVTGGSIISGNGTRSIQVTWNATVGSGQVCLTESDDICIGDQKCLDVTKSEACSAPTTGNISGNASVDISSSQNYSAPLSGNTYSWTVTGGSIISGNGTNTIQVTWNATVGSGQVCLTESDDICVGDLKCLTVTKNATCSTPTTGNISGALTSIVQTTETYSVSNSGNTYNWTVTGGNITSGTGTNSIVVTWGTGTTGEVCLTESDGSCVGNEVCVAITLSTPTGIAEIAYNKGLYIYPNPVSYLLNVVSKEIPTRIELIDLLGKVVAQYDKTLSFNNIINITDLSTNILFVKVHFSEGFALEKIVIQ